MPLLNQKSDLEDQYSTNCADDAQKTLSPETDSPNDSAPLDELEKLLADLDMGIEPTTCEEVVESMSNEVTTAKLRVSNEVTESTAKPVSNEVTKAKRRSDAKDRKVLETIRNFVPATAPVVSLALVAPSPPSISPPPSDKYPKPTTRKRSTIGAWGHTSDRMKLAAATIAIQAWGKNATSWTFNLPQPDIDKALVHPQGFVGSLNRALNRALMRKLGFRPNYLFSTDITKQGRLHLHGAIDADTSQLPLIEEAMKSAWGEWKERGKENQINWNRQRCDDGWPDYFLKARARVREKIGDHTYVITKKLRRKAKHIHSELNEIL